MKTSESLVKLSEAMVKAQKQIKHAIKDRQNPHFKNQYATLESVIDASKDALLDQGIFVTQAVTKEDLLITRLQHTSGEYIESEMVLRFDRENMQGMGSSITYARRYSLASMLNISQADDDGEENRQQLEKKPVEKKTYQKDPYMFHDGGFKGKKFDEIMPEDFDIYLGKLENIESDKKTAAVNELIVKMKQFKAEKQNAKSK